MIDRRLLLACLLGLAALAGCSSAAAPTDDAGRDGGSAEERDAGDDGGATLGDAGERVDAAMPMDAGSPVDAGPPMDGGVPMEVVPVPGEVTIVQLSLPALGLVPQTGEAAILVGPDGTMVLLDVGNDRHPDTVRAAIETLNTTWIVPERGFPRRRGRLEVDWIVLSHFHSDHVGGFAGLFESDPITLVHGVVHRGYVDLGAAASEPEFETMCDALATAALAGHGVSLCHAAQSAGCVIGDLSDARPALDCNGLFTGDLSDASDDALGEPSRIELGGGARMTFLGADGFVSDGSSASAITFGHTDSNEENARSLVTIVSFGAFRYHWGGDLTGSGDTGEPDVESHVASVAGAAFYGALGMDVTHAHHHVRATSSNATFVDLCAPRDGHDRNVVGGINAGYIRSPYSEVLARWADDTRLGTGHVWVTATAPLGASHPALIDAGGGVTVQTFGAGAGYFVQADGTVHEVERFDSVRGL
ncbi:MAG: MBL fold metallo-hydrolase [Sandaracinus sp.]